VFADPPPLEAYGKLPEVEHVSLSPSGKRVAAIATVGDTRSLVIRDVSGPVLNASVGNAKIRDVQWAGEDLVLVTSSTTSHLGPDFLESRADLASVLIIDLVSKKPHWALPKGAYPTAIMGQYGIRLLDGRWYGFFGAYDTDSSPRKLFKVDLATGGGQSISTASETFSTDWLIGPKGEIAARDEYDSEQGEWRLLSLAAGRHVLMSKKSPIHEIDVNGLGRTPDTALLSIPTEKGSEYEEVSLVDGAVAKLGDAETTTGTVRDSGGLLLGFETQDEPGAKLLDPTLQARFSGMRKAFKNYRVALLSHTDDLGRMVAFTDAGDDSGTFWIVDIASGKADVIGQAYPKVTSKDVGPTRMFSYKAADGLAMEGLLTLPPGRDPKGLPLVVMPHGGPIAEGDHPGFDWWAQAFASRGYAVFQPNFRGTDGYGRAFREAANGEWGGKMQTDISDGVAALVAQGIVDPKRACIVGASYGGYAALAGVTIQHGLYSCAVAVAPVTDLKSFIQWERSEHGSGEIVRWWRHLMGVKAESDPVLRAVSPALHADAADAPILLIHGVDDTTVTIDQSREMERALKAAGKPVEFVTLKGDDHYMSKSASRLEMLEASVGFVLKHDPPN
jgi:dipeptidyl aminopeptidase/acylaminoacyl peptidase